MYESVEEVCMECYKSRLGSAHCITSLATSQQSMYSLLAALLALSNYITPFF